MEYFLKIDHHKSQDNNEFDVTVKVHVEICKTKQSKTKTSCEIT